MENGRGTSESVHSVLTAAHDVVVSRDVQVSTRYNHVAVRMRFYYTRAVTESNYLSGGLYDYNGPTRDSIYHAVGTMAAVTGYVKHTYYLVVVHTRWHAFNIRHP